MNSITIFNDIIFDENKKPWFKAKDIINILEDDINNNKIYDFLKISYTENNDIYINKLGLYALLLFSQKEETKIFKIIKELLYSIENYIEHTPNIKINKLIKYFKKTLPINEELKKNTKYYKLIQSIRICNF